MRRASSRSLAAYRLPIGVLSILLLMVCWEWAGYTKVVDPRFISRPSLVTAAGADMVADSEFWGHVRLSAAEFAWGMVLSAGVGIPLGIAMGWFTRLRLFLEPMVMVFYSVPRTTFLPLIILWFGIGIQAYAFLVFLGAIFPIIVNCMAGIQQVDRVLIRAARSFGAKDGDIFRLVLVPSSLPYIMGGLRLGIGRGLIGIVLGEMYFSIGGVGNMIMRYQAGLNTDKLMFIVFFIAFSGVAMIEAARRLEDWLGPWRETRTVE